MNKTLASINEQIHTNEPKLSIGDYWVAKDTDGEVLRRVRIVGRYPFDNDHYYILIEEQPAKMKTGRDFEIGKCPEFNLRYVFSPEEVTA